VVFVDSFLKLDDENSPSKDTKLSIDGQVTVGVLSV